MYLLSKGEVLHDYDLELLKDICSFIDGKLQSLGESIDEEAEQCGLFDRLEHLVGLGFVACQTYMAATYGCANIRKDLALEFGPKVSSELFLTQMVNHAANMWKHCEEWHISGDDGPKRPLRKAFDAIGYSVESGYPLSGCLAEITGGQARFSVVVDQLCCWRNDLIKGLRA